MKTQRIGIYPGTFDPVHPGHIAFAREALQACQLDEVILLPERLPRGKQHVTGLAQRVTLLTKATATVANVRIAQLQSDQFTVAGTLPELEQLFPDAELTLLVGSDIARTFLYRWPGLEILLASMRLAIGLRGHDTPSEIAGIIKELEQQYGLTVAYTLIRTPHAHLASSHFRNT
jgi:nicotinate-nucleotide adenylyltransferase